MTEDVDEQPRGELTVRLVAMPSDTNANGDIFGGWVLSQMDQAGGIAAVETAQGRVATVAIDAMHFIRPVKVGDVLCVYTAVDHIGRTSLKRMFPPSVARSSRVYGWKSIGWGR